ncbi:hypothetical protein F2Q70_00028934 [Brassica cretica]|uniref:Uncharacterized protein n=1 Tax=Brassica cretica TaxID=69181 RepID=A0A8S9I8Q3_BRACR|nr:hypothetical protein F2Q68_00028497 [Brassica cretica]KAF2601132.1 hypothetical protein F2Q70_00028934 [Brassica cretica]
MYGSKVVRSLDRSSQDGVVVALDRDEGEDAESITSQRRCIQLLQAQRAFQAALALHDLNGVAIVLPYHIDSHITMADYFEFVGEHQVPQMPRLYRLERAWYPMFTPFNGICRLKFTHETNKPFFSSLFRHMRNMDRPMWLS